MRMEVTQYGCHTSNHTEADNAVSTNICGQFVHLTDEMLGISLEEDMPRKLYMFEELADEMAAHQMYDDMLIVTFPEAPTPVIQVQGTEAAMQMFRHGCDQNEYEIINWV